MTSVIGCVSGASNHSEESLSTLRFVERAKKMKNNPRVNQDPRNHLIEENLRLKERVRQLEAEVELLRGSGCCNKKCSGCSVM
jgi:kinesin family protein 3/17